MAPSRGKGKNRVHPLRNTSPAQGNRRTPRRAAQQSDGVPSIYKDMLAEASEGSEDVDIDRPLKKRKVVGSGHGTKNTKPNLQTVEDSASTDNSDDSEFEFEDIDLEHVGKSSTSAVGLGDHDIADVSVAVDSTKAPKRATMAKRKAATPAEKAHHLVVHKLHILCLLGHILYVNTWCNDSEVHSHLRKLVPEKAQSYLAHNSEHSQFQQNRSFLDGLQQAVEFWRGIFKITASGLRRSKWNVPGSETQASEDDPHDRSEFRRTAEDLEGSQDTGNQLFCALLRAVGVDARVVCSLQVLPFGASSKESLSTPHKDKKTTVFATASGVNSPATDSNPEDPTMQYSSTVGRVPSARRRLGQPSFSNNPPDPTVTPKKRRPIHKLTHPIFWVEAFNRSHQTWIPVDPLVTQTIGKAAKLEPPRNYEWNQMIYVIALEHDGVARDVTKRYSNAYNAKTRRLRVEGMEENGAIWMRKALRIFRRPRSDESGKDRDQIEDAQLAQREAQEGLPTNVQDFKYHPYYALERHMRRHEVIYPHREVGKVNAGTAARPRMEAVFRRSDVQACKSAERWFRIGREIKEGEQPLKRVPARKSRIRRANSEDQNREEVMISALYAPFQTRLYTPPPVENGRVPRNAYGNLDVYVPSMVPSGGRHMHHPLAKEAARILRIDAVDAVTGFKFQGRQGTAIIEGVVVAARFKEAVEAVVDGLQNDQTEKEGMARSILALKMWKRFLIALRIKERVSAYGETKEIDDDVDMAEREDNRPDAAGGFLSEEAVSCEEAHVLPTAGKYSLAELLDATPTKSRARRSRKTESDESDEAESSDADEPEEETGGFELEFSARRTRARKRAVIEDDSGDENTLQTAEQSHNIAGVEEDREGGFVPKQDIGAGFVAEDGMEGGFMIEDERSSKGDMLQEAELSGGFIVDEAVAETTQKELRHISEEITQEEIVESVPAEPQSDVSMGDRSTPTTSQVVPLIWQEPEHNGFVDEAEVGNPGRVEASEDAQISRTTGQGTPNARSQLEWQVHGLAEARDHEWLEEIEDDSDRGSMLSHDPEDEDAEPDWLESD